MSKGAELGQAGRELVDSITEALPREVELDEREQALLQLAARQADDIARLEADISERGTTVSGSRAGTSVLNPSISEVRQGRLALGKLLAGLELPDLAGRPRNEASRRAQRAADKRWGAEVA
jgi:septal ring factor EnvC (AmiA/AmiB activator)